MFYAKERLHLDLDNGLTSIPGLLRDAGVIANDTQCVRITASKKGGAPDILTQMRWIGKPVW